MIVTRNYKEQKSPGGGTVQGPKELMSTKSDIIVVGSKDYFEDISKCIQNLDSNSREIVLIDTFLNNYPKVDTMTNYYVTVEKKQELISLMKEIGDLPIESFEKARVFANRVEALKIVPRGGIVAEIGVALGYFSDQIINWLQPDHFYAVDYFNRDNPDVSFWGYNCLKETGMLHEEWYRHKYSNLININKMSVCSGMSWDVMEGFEDDFFDYIYVDAGHDYESVKKDIEVSVKKIKKGGYIQFNDYTLQNIEGEIGSCYGIVPAVNEMIIDTKSQIIGYAMQILGYCDLLVKVNK